VPTKGGRAPVRDDYAEHRCKCRHLVYADDQPGGQCRWCGCTDHRPAVTQPAPVGEDAVAARAVGVTEAAGQVTGACGVAGAIPDGGAAA
jgi:hypothetical protein